MSKTTKTDSEWRDQLSPQQYKITRKSGTERAFSSPLNEEHRTGTFTCVCCGEALFDSDAKFDSHSGWPSFFQPHGTETVSEHEDRKLFSTRTEVRCAKCEAHLGHVFPDGPEPTGQRFCINGLALDFDPNETD